ncbi:MAG: helix-turn-helix domain-containing protein [Gammaproteobacteria bacterium]|nr:helix-turn-helix domain-containing protein [Gammaproteobacteria bacterium]
MPTKQNNVTEKIYYGIDELKDRWGLGRSTIYDLMNDGELASVKIRTRRLIPVAAVIEYEAKISQ